MNNYFNFAPRFIPFTRVQAEPVNAQFDAVEAAFDLLPADPASIAVGSQTVAPESGAGNSYVVAMPTPRVANAAGDEVVFRATHSNSNASTLNVDGIGAVPIVNAEGDPLLGGELVAGVWVSVRYDAAGTRFQMMTPTRPFVPGDIPVGDVARKSQTNAFVGLNSFAAATAFSAAVTIANARLTITNDEGLRIAGNNAYISFFDNTNTTRQGFLRIPISGVGPAELATETNQALRLSTNSVTRISIAGDGTSIALAATTVTTSADFSVGGVTTIKSVQPAADATYALGTQALRFNTVFANSMSSGPAATNQVVGTAGTVITIGSGSTWTSISLAKNVTVAGNVTTTGTFVSTAVGIDAIKIIGTNSTISFWNTANTVRAGYIYGSVGSLILVAESGKSLLLGVNGGFSQINIESNGQVLSDGSLQTRGCLRAGGQIVTGYTGVGAELAMISGVGNLSATNRSLATYLPIQIDGLTVALRPGGVQKLLLTAAGEVVTPNLSAAEVGFKGTPLATPSGSYTVAAADIGGWVHCAGPSDSVTVPTDAQVAIPIGSNFQLTTDQFGGLVITPFTGVTLFHYKGDAVSPSGARTLAQHSHCLLRKINANTWIITGEAIT